MLVFNVLWISIKIDFHNDKQLHCQLKSFNDEIEINIIYNTKIN